MKVYLTKKDPTEFLKFSIQRNFPERTQASISKYVIQMFDHPHELLKVVEENQFLKDDTKAEYLYFFDELAKKNFKEAIEVDFKSDLHKEEKK